MNEVKTFTMKAIRKVYRKVSGKTFMDHECIINREKANDIIENLINSNKPCMLSRFGSIELYCVLTYMIMNDRKTSMLRKLYNYVTDLTELPWWDPIFNYPFCNNAGVFPPTVEIMERFAQRYLEDIPYIDVLASVFYKEKFMPLSPNVKFIQFETVYPFFVNNPWTRSLKGKKVLIIHPCEKTIRQQYAKREKLFDNSDILPEFTLLTLKSVQSACGEKTKYKDWFEALDYMKEQINQMVFDVAIIGCGAYGLPLAAHIKRMGKKAIHIGGGTQLLFGIKGRRWDVVYKWPYKTPIQIPVNYADLYNDFWTRPLQEECPSNPERVENGCYW